MSLALSRVTGQSFRNAFLLEVEVEQVTEVFTAFEQENAMVWRVVVTAT